MKQKHNHIFIITLLSSIILSSISAGVVGFWAGSLSSSNRFNYYTKQNNQNTTQHTAEKNTKTTQSNTIKPATNITSVVKKVSPAVVSIIITKDLPKMERYYSNPFPDDDFFNRFFNDDFFNFNIPQYRQNGTEKREIGGGTGFIISQDGYIVTNKHVAADTTAEYTVLMNNEKKYDAKVIAKDPANDLAILKITGKNFPTVKLGDSSKLQVGQTVIAIGNALGEFRNTVSVGVISGLSRSITAGSSGFSSEHLTGVIQTDASINPGNSGGPLLNTNGEVIGINTAIARGAQNIGFAIPINEVKNSIESVQKYGRIIRPWLGVRYVMLTKEIAEQNKLSINEGALIVRGTKRTELAVIPGSPADKAGLQENDIILEVNGKKINKNYPLISAINKFKPGNTIKLKIMHKGVEKYVNVRLEEMK